MEAQEHTQIFTPLVQKVKEEEAEAYSFPDEDQLTGKNPLDFPLNMVSDNSIRSESSERGREIADNFSAHFEAQSRVMARAEEIQASLSPEFPSFWKLMTRSHVTQGFLLGISTEMCKLHMPKLDAPVVLEDESGEKYHTKYLADRMTLSGGWKGFAIAQKLFEGDAVVFHLFNQLRPMKFKVYVVRAKDFEVADALSLPNSDACAKETGFGSISDIMNFNIVVNGLTIDLELSTRVRTKYYDLCCTQKSCLHEGFLSTIDSKMAVGIISVTVNIAEAIQACKISISPNDLAIWDKTLEGFGLLGMNVGFLRDRLNRLMSLLSESKAVSNRYAEASIERDGVQSEMKSLELKLLEMKKDRRRLDDQMEDLMEKTQQNEFLFQTEAIAPWRSGEDSWESILQGLGFCTWAS